MSGKRQKVILTGGLGYVGGRIARHLAQTGEFEVWVTSRKVPVSLPEFPCAIQQVNLADPVELSELLRGADAVVHLAAVNEIVSTQDPLYAQEINTRQSLLLLQEAVKAQVSKFVYFSTIHVYGRPLEGKITEERLPIPVHPYAINHKGAEDYVIAALLNQQIEGAVFRLSNSFGAPVWPEVDRWTLLVNDLCRQAFTQGKLVLKSDGTQLRDFVTLTDVSRAVEHMLQVDQLDVAVPVFNLGGEKALSVLQMTEWIANRFFALFGKHIPIEIGASQATVVEQKGLAFSIDKLKRTGFVLQNNIEQEIDDMLLFCKQHFEK
ncbi:SDR family oxidoreductase [Rapidithrix thailandica]|uniref:SDR family oxidoreductase n=1 Tax=Rapidithrix thailandica TaxID=413964 RepID=A0AAW9SDA7_9BACT